MFLKNRKIISKIKRSKVTDYAALRVVKSSKLLMAFGCKRLISMISTCLFHYLWVKVFRIIPVFRILRLTSEAESQLLKTVNPENLKLFCFVGMQDVLCFEIGFWKFSALTHVYMRFPTMWYVRLAKPQISLRICAV